MTLNLFFKTNFFVIYELNKTIRSFSQLITGDKDKVLDIGSGSSNNYFHYFDEAILINLDLKDVFHYEPLNNRISLIFDGHHIPVKTSSIDFILCTQSIYQAEDFNLLIDEIFRVLKRGGHFLITVPFVWFDSNQNLERRYSMMYLTSLLMDKNVLISHVKRLNTGFEALIILFQKFMFNHFINIHFKNKYLKLFAHTILSLCGNILILILRQIQKPNPNLYINISIVGVKL